MAPRAAQTLPPYAVYRDLRSSFLPRDNDTLQLDIHRARLHTIYAKPFNHLSIWAYLAFAFIILGLSTVVAYLIYTCYHSSKRTMGLDKSAPDAADMGREDSIRHWEYSAPSTSSSGRGRGVGSMVKIGVGEVGEKSGTGNSRAIGSRNDVEMKGFSSGHNKMGSESEENIFSLPSNSMWESICNINDTSFEINNNHLSSPPLAHISDKAAAYIPFHLPPPPPSPTPAYKEHLERQYRGRRPGGQHSPVSPSPSCSFSPATSLPPITPHTASSLILGDPDNTWSSTSTNISPTENLTPSYKPMAGSGQPSKVQVPPVHFDSNNIRYVPPLNPFMTPSTILLFNEPKLSPILGTLTSNHHAVHASGSGSSAGDSSFSRAVLAASRSALPEVSPQKRAKGSSVSQSDPMRREDKENVHPSSFNTNLYPTHPLNGQPNPMPF